MEEKNRRFRQWVIHICNALVFSYLLFQNQNEFMVLIGVLGALVVASFVMILHVIKVEAQIRLTSFFLIALIYWIQLLDKSGTSQVFVIIFVSVSILNFELSFGYGLSAVAILSSFYVRFAVGAYENLMDFIPAMLEMIFPYTVFVIVISLLRQTIDQKSALTEANQEIFQKQQALEATTEKLKQNLEDLEDMAIEKERNRIAREIHDTVGHTLTTVLIEIEAGKRLLEKDKATAKEKLELAQEQVRKGLNDIRKSVRLLKEGDRVLDFIPSMILLMEETEKHAEVSVKYEIIALESLEGEVGKTLYHCLQEGITNGLKHGSANKFWMKLSGEEDEIFLSIQDNGTGIKTDSVMGFGLSSMTDRVKYLKGKILFKNTNQGFLIEVKIPKERRADESN